MFSFKQEWPCTLNDVNSSLEEAQFRCGKSDCFPTISGQIDVGIPSPLGLHENVAILVEGEFS